METIMPSRGRTPTKTISRSQLNELTTLQQELQKIHAEQERVALLVERALARGTGDVSDHAAEVRATLALPERVEAVLRHRGPVSTQQLAREVGEPQAAVDEARATFEKAGRVRNVNTEVDPAWIWVVGDESGVQELYDVVARLIRYRPMSYPELMTFTGARGGRISGAIVRLQQDERTRIVNMGTPKRARWFLAPTGIALARIKTPR